MGALVRRKPRRLRRRRSPALVVICSSALLLAGAAFLAARPSGSATAATEPPPLRIVTDDDVVLIPTPARPVARGEKIGNVPLATIKWPKSKLTPEYVSDIAAYRDSSTLTPLPKLLPIPISALNAGGVDNNQVTEAIPSGMRAITVRVDAESAVEGWAQSGNYVDVLLVRASKEQEGMLETRLISENIKILSAGRSAEPSRNDQTAPKAPSTVTLLTSQDDALKIKTAANLGRLTFALRGIGDQLPTAATSLDQRSLLGSSKAIMSSKKAFRGLARSADGRTYVLDDDARWLESPGEQARFKIPAAATETEK